ncbi:progressive ankylosis protein homolog isoform X2 [Acanthaster planci]|uniref:Progressive ankylosis protein homolog isoform X2 n=1 Tax=Acanthaster planci TaxID=133434 RepID=A0A8B7XFE0_ACAPL|nr:progressive ankylosis protein homolog isoform X2 [Acanthaster planci]
MAPTHTTSNMTTITYARIIKFMVPLAFTKLVVIFGNQALSRGLTSAENATQALASFGIAFFICQFMVGIVFEFTNVSLVLVRSKRDGVVALVCMLVVGVLIVATALLIGLTAFGTFLTDTVYNLSQDVALDVRKCMLYLAIWPLIEGLNWFLFGLLLSREHSVFVGAAQVLDIVVRVVFLFLLPMTSLLQTRPLLIPILSMYTGMFLRVSTALAGYVKYLHRTLERDTPVNARLTARQAYSFWLPLAIVNVCQNVSFPLTNLLVARDLADTPEEAAKAIATLSICYPTSMMTYHWLIDGRFLFPLYLDPSEEPVENDNRRNTVHHITRFNIGYFVISLTICVILFWIPDVINNVLMTLLGLDKTIADMCIVPLRILTAIPITVSIRTHLTSWLMCIKRAEAVYPSAAVRLVFAVASVFVLPVLGMHGAPMGALSLVICFTLEMLAVVVAAAFINYWNKGRQSDLTPTSRYHPTEDELYNYCYTAVSGQETRV